MKNNEDSIYQLITDLCLKFTAHKDVKKIRTKCYEIILGKKYPQLSDNEVLRKDPMIDLIWWKMMLVENRLPDWARDLSNAVDVAQEAYGENQYDFKHILEFLLTLKREPIGDSHKLDLWALPDILEDLNFMKQFELPQSLKVEWEKNQEYTLMKNHIFITCGSKRSVRLPTTVNSGTTIETDPDMIHQQNPPSIDLSFSKTLIDEGYISPEENIWKLATTLPVYKRRTWEALGILEPEKELPFLSELGDLQSLWIDNLPFLYYSDKTRHENVLKYTMKTKRTFIKDVKYLLVGMSSDSFCVNKNGEFYIMPSISIEGITPMSLQTYCQDLLFAGTCYKALSNLSTPNPATGKYEFQGYIITEFYKSIGRYLQFYNTAIMGIPDDIAILMLHDRTHIVRTQIITLASICKIGPFAEDTFIPHGVALLNYLYKTVLAISDRNVLMVLYSILYPCCQVYFNRFLSQWILEGIINDPYGEFFIQVNVKYLPTRGRTYWTRSVSFRDDIVPDFLTDFKDDIFYCGKLMNLLKLCDQDSKLCVYLSGNKPPIITCCLTCEHLAELKQSTMNYYLEVCSDCGGIFDLEEYLDRCEGSDPVLLNLIAKKRSATLKKLELERKRTDMIVNEKQQEEFQMLKEQYDIALEMKQLHVAKEVEREMKMLQKNASLEQKRQDLIDKESTKLIEYYSNLCADSELKLQKMANNNKALKAILIEGELDKVSVTSDEIKVVKIASNFTINDSESNLTFSVKDTSVVNEKPEVDIQKKTSTVNKDLDELNANKIVDATTSPKSDKERYDESIHKTINILEVAKNIKKKVMTEEMGLINNEPLKKSPLLTPQMMEARRNKVKILSAEFGIDIRTEDVVKSRPMTSLQINRNKMMMTSPNCYGMQYNDNEDQANKNIPESKIDVMKKSKSLTLDLQKSKETEKPTPMSVDSTPLSDVIPASGLHTPASTILDSIPTTSETRQTDDGGFDFSVEPEIKLPTVEITTRSFSKLITKQEAANIFTNCTKIFIIDSIMEPLKAQTKLANSELMKLFIEKLQFLNHLNTLRNYFFMQDGEFGRNMTENLFEKLYEVSAQPEDLNCRLLHNVAFGVLDFFKTKSKNASGLSFKINNLPKGSDLSNPDVLDCLSLTYKMEWPMNILLPSDIIARYDELFRFLMKLKRLDWVLKKSFMDLKVMIKSNKAKPLTTSPHFRKVECYRHIMMHVVQCIQNYIVGIVLQNAWTNIKKDLCEAKNIDDLYHFHMHYIKNILHKCFLSQKTSPFKDIIRKIFIVIFKFNNHIQPKNWKCVDHVYVHSSFVKIEIIFNNFIALVQYFIKVLKKVTKTGYHPQLLQFIYLLDLYEYFSKSKT